MSTYIFNNFNNSKENNRLATMLTYSDINPRSFSKNRFIFKKLKTSYISSNSLLYHRKTHKSK